MRKFIPVLVAALAGCATPQIPVTQSATYDAPKTYTHHLTFRFIGNKQQMFKVPKDVAHIFVVAIGGEGGGATISHGGRVSAIVPVTPRETLTIHIGGNGGLSSGGYNGGGDGGSNAPKGNGYGGGGATDIRANGDSLADRIVVAGGGGGQGGDDSYNGSHAPYGFGGKGGGLTGGPGDGGWPSYYGTNCYGDYFSCGGEGGGQTRGGAAGTGGEGFYCYGSAASSGVFGIGGAGAEVPSGTSSYQCGGLGGGGGGGYYGGGGGGSGGSGDSSADEGGGGGGGGSSYVEPTATDVHMWRGWKSNEYGLIVISW